MRRRRPAAERPMLPCFIRRTTKKLTEAAAVAVGQAAVAHQVTFVAVVHHVLLLGGNKCLISDVLFAAKRTQDE